MVSSERWHTARRWAVVAFWLVSSVTAVSAQDGRWERVTAVGVQAFGQGDYAGQRGSSRRLSPWRMQGAWRPVS